MLVLLLVVPCFGRVGGSPPLTLPSRSSTVIVTTGIPAVMTGGCYYARWYFATPAASNSTAKPMVNSSLPYPATI